MSLADYQRSVLHASYAQQPADSLFEALGNPERFRIYRHMIRARLNAMAHVAFARSSASVGRAAFDASFERYLAEQPPTSALIRDVIEQFGPYAQRDRTLLSQAPAYLSDLLRFEEAKWRLAYAACVRPKVGVGGVRELDFEGSLVLNPVLAQLQLGFPVHTLDKEGSPLLTAKPFTLLVYRPDGVDEVRWYAADPLFSALLAAAGSGASLADLVREVAAEQGRALDEALLEGLSTSLTLALTRGVLVGVRAQER